MLAISGSLRTPRFREKDYCPYWEDLALPQTLMSFCFPGLLGTDFESKQCHAFWRALHRKQMFKFSLGSYSFVADNFLAHLSAWGTATQPMFGGDSVPTKQPRIKAFWAGHCDKTTSGFGRQPSEALRRSQHDHQGGRGCHWLPGFAGWEPQASC